jgi:hypothetical protein
MADYDRSATGPLPVDAGPRRAESIFDLSPEDFRASLGEMQAMGHDTDALMRQYRAVNSPFAPINNAAAAQQQGLADSGRRPVLGGLLSKPEGAMGMDALAGLEFEGLGGLLGAGQAIGQGLDAPAAAAQGLIPQADVNMEALNTAGMAMGAGGAATAPAGALRSGLAREAGLSEAQRQARDILDMRAAGRAGEVTDDMMARADDQYMFDNTPLPMDEASRLARADAGGFGGDLYHGTADEYGINSFDVSKAGSVSQQPNERAIFATDSPDAASWFANYADPDGELTTYGGATMGTVMPVMRRGDYQTLDFRGQPYGNSRMERGLESARRAGADGVSVRGMRENLDGFKPIINQEAIFDPSNIRSRFARFDPEFSHLSNLSAANASPTAGLLASGAQEQDKPLPFMEMLRGLLR